MAYKFNPFTSKLEEYGPILTGTGTVSAAADGTAALPGIAFTNDLNTGIYRPGADELAISTNGTGRLFVDASGRILAGVSSSSGPYRAIFQGHADDPLDAAIISLQRGQQNPPNNGFIGVINFRDSAGSIGSTISAATEATWATGSYPTRLIFSTTASGASSPTERLRITSTGLVGVGTSSPNQLLEISSSSQPSLRIQNTLNSGAWPSGEIIGQIEFFSSDPSASGAHVTSYIRSVNETLSGLLPDGALTFGTAQYNTGAAVERLRITNTGRVGLGTTSPGEKVTVTDGNIQIETSTTNGADLRLKFKPGFSGTFGTQYIAAINSELRIGASTVGGTNAFTSFYGSSGTEAARITSTGQLRLAGAGITFNGDTATANELDDYEEGTWTPVYTPTTGSFTTMTMNVQSARYVKIGQLVTVQAYIVTSNVDVTGASGSVNITGLPFTSYSAQALRRSGAIGFSASFATAPQFWGITENSTTVNLYEARVDALDVADLSTGAGSFNIIWLEASYYAA